MRISKGRKDNFVKSRTAVSPILDCLTWLGSEFAPRPRAIAIEGADFLDKQMGDLGREDGGLPVIRLRTLIRTDWLEKTGYMRVDGDQKIRKIQALAGR